MNYQNKHLVGAMIVAGYDEHEGGQVYGCPIGGTLVREAWAIDGSGSTYIWGYCDSAYRWGLCRGTWHGSVQHHTVHQLACFMINSPMACDVWVCVRAIAVSQL